MHRQLLAQLRELQRLDLDLLVRDVEGPEALRLLGALKEEVEKILASASEVGTELGASAQRLEASLAQSPTGEESAGILESLAATRRSLAELEEALAPCHVLFEEVSRRCTRRG